MRALVGASRGIGTRAAEGMTLYVVNFEGFLAGFL